MGNVRVIDVSKHQGKIDFAKVKKSGINHVILRAGYGMSSMDSCFSYNIKEAIKYGFNIGIYWFIYAINTYEAVKNAEMCDKVIAPYKDKITLKVISDYEYDSDTYSEKKGVKQTKISRTDIVKAFNSHLASKGYDVAVYANRDYLKNKFNDLSEYPLWYALYGASKPDRACYMWQYTSAGKVPGINGNIDISILYAAVSESDTKKYFAKYIGNTVSIKKAMESIGEDGSFEYRKVVAKVNAIKDYRGSEEQNKYMLSLLKQGKLIKP